MRATGKLLGRSTALWVSLVGSALNFVVGVGILHMDVIQLGLANTLAIALIGILANEENPTTAGTLEATTQTPEITITGHVNGNDH